jgi:hypothetical protein
MTQLGHYSKHSVTYISGNTDKNKKKKKDKILYDHVSLPDKLFGAIKIYRKKTRKISETVGRNIFM